MENLKDLVRDDLKELKEKERQERIEKNKKLTEVTVYTKNNNPTCKNLLTILKQEGIKFIEKDIDIYPAILATVQMNSVPVVFINDNYLVHGRDFQNPNQCINILQHLANPDFVNPSNDVKMIESIKNLNFNISKSMQNLNRQLQPIVQLLNSLREEEKEENKDAKKNN